MKAIIFSPKGKKDLELSERNKPEISQNEVLVKVKEVGLDGTDKEIIQGDAGEIPEDKDGLIIGHECLGEVVKTGGNVENFESGDLVVPTVRRPDDCINCQEGEYDMCLNGNYTERGIKEEDGYLAEYFKEKPKFLVKIPKEIKETAVLLEPTSVAEKAVRTGYSVQDRMTWKPETALVAGSGTLGLLISYLLSLRDLDVNITDVEEDERKKDILSTLSIRHFDGRDIKLHDIPDELGKQIDIIMEATGDSSVAFHSMFVVGTNGVVVLLSVTGGNENITFCADCLNEGLVLENKSVVGSVNSNKDDFKKGIEDMKKIEEKWPGLMEKLITARHDVSEIDEAIENMGDNIKTIIEF